MPGLVVSSDSGFAVIRMAGKCTNNLSSRTQCGHLLARRLLLSFHSIAMTSSGLSWRTQCGHLLARRLLQSFHSIAMTSSGLSWRTQCGDLLARRLPRRAFSTARNKKRAASFLASAKNRW